MTGELPSGLGAIAAAFRPFFGEHNCRVSDLNLGVGDSAFNFKAHHLCRAEGILIKFESLWPRP